MGAFLDYVKTIRSYGQRYFTVDQAMQELQISRNAVLLAVSHLKKSGDLISPAKSLYIIVPPEHQPFGCIPADDLIPILMKHWGIDYYAGLLTAALYHGASHQKPQRFQVITNKQVKRKLIFGQIHIECIFKKHMVNLPIQDFTVRTGYLKISSPELTVLDLFLYPDKSGGLNHIATILSELIEAIDPDKLIALAKQVPEKFWLQRLGYILDKIDPVDEEAKAKILDKLYDYIKHKELAYMPLTPELNTISMPRCEKWKIVENTTVEADI